MAMQRLMNMRSVFVASSDNRIASAVKCLLPHVDVKSVDVNENDQLNDSGRKLIEEEAEILFADGSVLLEVANSAKQLKWAACTWAGVEKIVAGLKDKPPSCLLTRCGGAFNSIMAEYVLGYIIAKERFIVQMADQQRNKQWNKSAFSDYRSISELTLGILGVGEIGSSVAKFCHNAGMTVIGVNRSLPDESRRCSAIQQYFPLSDLPFALRQCDYVCSILPSTLETRGLLSGDVFSHCQNKKAIFINIGRGDVTDEESLVKAIRNGWLGGAVLDVFPTEPLSSDSPLWSLPGVTVTPHIAGVSLPKQAAKSFVSNYELYCQNKPLNFVVDFQRGY